MKKLKRTSYFDSNRSSYLDAEKQEYVYEFISYDEKGRQVPTRQAIAITKDNIEIIKALILLYYFIAINKHDRIGRAL